ncbi:MAG: TRAM domain-containing protein, partial [Kofleriaceae bacterium]
MPGRPRPPRPQQRPSPPPLSGDQFVEVTITSLAAGGDGVARDEAGRVTFVPRSAPGDRVRARLVQASSSFARGALAEILTPAASRVLPPCKHFLEGCGGCAWQHVARAEQLLAKQTIVAGALRKLEGLVVHDIADPAPPYGWRRRARFHVAGGKLGLFVLDSHQVLPLDQCPQLEPALDEARALIARST